MEEPLINAPYKDGMVLLISQGRGQSLERSGILLMVHSRSLDGVRLRIQVCLASDDSGVSTPLHLMAP